MALTIAMSGLYQYKVMRSGLQVMPAMFQRLLDLIIGPAIESKVFTRCYSRILEEHLTVLKDIFQ